MCQRIQYVLFIYLSPTLREAQDSFLKKKAHRALKSLRYKLFV